jgi:hypothetical protein
MLHGSRTPTTERVRDLQATSYMNMLLSIASGNPTGWLQGNVALHGFLVFHEYDGRLKDTDKESTDGRVSRRTRSANKTWFRPSCRPPEGLTREEIDDPAKCYAVFGMDLHNFPDVLSRLLSGAREMEGKPLVDMTAEERREYGFDNPRRRGGVPPDGSKPKVSRYHQWTNVGKSYDKPMEGTAGRTLMMRPVPGLLDVDMTFKELNAFASFANLQLDYTEDPTARSPRFGDCDRDDHVWGVPVEHALSGQPIVPGSSEATDVITPTDFSTSLAWIVYTIPANVYGKVSLATDGLQEDYEEEVADGQYDNVQSRVATSLDRLETTPRWQSASLPQGSVIATCEEDHCPNQGMSNIRPEPDVLPKPSLDNYDYRRDVVTSMYRRNVHGTTEIGARPQVCAVTALVINEQLILYAESLSVTHGAAKKDDIDFLPERYGALAVPLTRALFPNGYDLTSTVSFVDADLTAATDKVFPGGAPHLPQG